MEKKNENQNSENNKDLKLITKVKIINYSSKNLVIDFLNKFLSENNYPKDYTLSESSIFLIIKFNNSDIAYLFVKKLNYEKLININFSSIEVSMNMEIEKPKHSNLILGRRSLSIPKLKIKPILNKKNLQLSLSKINIKPKYHFNNRLSELAYHSILASTPYRHPYEEQKKINKENKIKWISERNFNGYFGRATSNKNIFYHDFISDGMPSPPISFRPIEKKKWISKNDFFVC
jgi:hypothetical protein